MGLPSDVNQAYADLLVKTLATLTGLKQMHHVLRHLADCEPFGNLKGLKLSNVNAVGPPGKPRPPQQCAWLRALSGWPQRALPHTNLALLRHGTTTQLCSISVFCCDSFSACVSQATKCHQQLLSSARHVKPTALASCFRMGNLVLSSKLQRCQLAQVVCLRVGSSQVTTNTIHATEQPRKDAEEAPQNGPSLGRTKSHVDSFTSWSYCK